jgi:hypothetical protein
MTANAKHTPGPWECDTLGWPLLISAPPTQFGEDGSLVASVDLPSGSEGDDASGLRALANARLIHLAPEMAEMLLEWADWDGPKHACPGDAPCRACRTRALLSRLEDV